MAQVNALVRCVAFALAQSHVAVAMPTHWLYDERNPDAELGLGRPDGNDGLLIPDDVGSELWGPTHGRPGWNDALEAGPDVGPEPPLPELPPGVPQGEDGDTPVFEPPLPEQPVFQHFPGTPPAVLPPPLPAFGPALLTSHTAPEFNFEPEPAFVEDLESSDFSDDSHEIRAEAAVFTPKGLRRSSSALVRHPVPVVKKLVRKPVAGARDFFDEEEEDFDQEGGDFIDEDGRLVREELMFDEDEAKHLPLAIQEWEFDTGSSGASKLASAAALLALLA